MFVNLPVRYDSLSSRARREVRMEYVRRQNRMCKHCGEPLGGQPARHVQAKKVDYDLFPKGFFMYRVHLHHDHKTGMTVGAVHSYCNAVLWQYHGK